MDSETVLSAETQLLSYSVLQIIFLCYIIRIVYQSLLSVRSVNQEVIYASIALYLLFRICLTLIYYAIFSLEPSAFGGKSVLDSSDAHSVSKVLQELIYFSLVTQTTLGYGDLSLTLGCKDHRVFPGNSRPAIYRRRSCETGRYRRLYIGKQRVTVPSSGDCAWLA